MAVPAMHSTGGTPVPRLRAEFSTDIFACCGRFARTWATGSPSQFFSVKAGNMPEIWLPVAQAKSSLLHLPLRYLIPLKVRSYGTGVYRPNLGCWFKLGLSAASDRATSR